MMMLVDDYSDWITQETAKGSSDALMLMMLLGSFARRQHSINRVFACVCCFVYAVLCKASRQ